MLGCPASGGSAKRFSAPGTGAGRSVWQNRHPGTTGRCGALSSNPGDTAQRSPCRNQLSGDCHAAPASNVTYDRP